jgi:hypothetical protein
MSEEERPKRLVGWTREQWGRIVAFHGGLDGVRAFLQGSPCRVGPGGGINFARTIVSWSTRARSRIPPQHLGNRSVRRPGPRSSSREKQTQAAGRGQWDAI